MSKGAKKYDEGKVAFIRGCLQRFPRALLEVAKVSAVGCRKYDLPLDDTDFLDVPDGLGRYTDALGRHLLKEALEGNINIEVGGNLPKEGVVTRHDAQVAWNALARLEIKLREEEDN